jgi:uncharacterized protein
MMQPATYLTDEQARALYAPLSAPDSTSKQAADSAHDFDHVARVTRLAVCIAEAEHADVEVVRLAALLHDVPVIETTAELGTAPAGLEGREHHHLAAAEYAGELLAARGLAPERVANVVHCIAAHRFRDRRVSPATLEAKCLYDADKLDSIGAIGIARAFAFAGAHQSRLWHEPWPSVPPDDAKPQGSNYTPVHEFVYKLQRIASTLHTDTARCIAAERHRFMCAFFDRLDAEMLGIA